MKIAVAATREGTIFDGHFAHAPVFKIYNYAEGGRVELLEERANPLGEVPDLDAGPHHHAHGIAKYAWLRERVLPDVDVVIAAGACQTSHNYFTSLGVRMLYTDPVEVDLLLKYIKENPQEFEEMLGSPR